MFEIDGVDYTYSSRIIDTEHGPETLVKIYFEHQLIHTASEAMSAADIIADFIQERRNDS